MPRNNQPITSAVSFDPLDESLRRMMAQSFSFTPIRRHPDTTRDRDGNPVRVGDTVEVLPDSRLHQMNLYRPGEKAKVVHIDFDGDIRVRDPRSNDERDTVYCQSSGFRLVGVGAQASSSTMSGILATATHLDANGKLIKPGMWVRVLKDSGDAKGWKGKVAQVLAIETDPSDAFDIKIQDPTPGNEEKHTWVPSNTLKIARKPKTLGKPSVSMDSVILPDDKKESILAALSQVKHHNKIFSRWGFEQVFEKGTAVSLLFWGVPGTGKTLMAQAIADKLSAELKTIGAGEIETAEPGGAERTIQKIFAEANTANADAIGQVILFDECDSLLMDRNKVGPIIGATINCLLTEIEKYKGVVIFTTNRLGQLDAALERRISSKVEFTFPDAGQREQIWKRMIPKKAPLDEDVNLAALAELPIAGGNIKNAVLSAARAAAHAGQKSIRHDDLLQAAKAEVQSREEFKKQIEAQDQTRLIGPGRPIVSEDFSEIRKMLDEAKTIRDWMSVKTVGGVN